MRTTILGLVAGVMLWGAASADEAPNAAIQGTIQSQIDAFLMDDFVTAFTFAAPNIQSMFRTPENFGAMVRNGYPMVWRPGDVRFGELREIGGALWQKVIVSDAEGQFFVLDYMMVEQDGNWRIAAVQVLPAPEMSA